MFLHLLNQKKMTTVVVTLIVAFLLAMPPQLGICKAIPNDFQVGEGGLLKDILVSIFFIFNEYYCIYLKIDKNLFSYNCTGELHNHFQ